IAHRLGCADADELHGAIDQMKQEIEPARSQTLLFKFTAKCINELADITGDCFRCTDRFTEDAAHLNQFWRTNRIDRFSDTSKRLVEPPGDFRTKTQDKRGPWLIHQLTDGLKAQCAKSNNRLAIKPESRQWQRTQHRLALTLEDNHGAPVQEARCRMGGTPAVGNGRPGFTPRVLKLLYERFKHQSLTAMQVLRSCCVEDEAIGRISGNVRRDPLQSPEG